MGKPATELIKDLRSITDQLENETRFTRVSALVQNSNFLKKENEKLKKAAASARKSKAQYQGMYERKNKECLRTRSEVEVKEREVIELKKLVWSLGEEIKLIQGNYDHLYDMMNGK